MTGFGPLNWNSLAIDDFILSCTRAIKEFQDIVHQVQKNAAMIGMLLLYTNQPLLFVVPGRHFSQGFIPNRLFYTESVIRSIRTAQLINLAEFSDRRAVYRVDNLFERIERTRYICV